MEYAVDGAIEKILKLSTLQRFTIAKNLQFQSKMNILKILVSLSYLNDTKKKDYTEVLDVTNGYSYYRNTIAHEFFASSAKTDGVGFVLVAAKGKLQIPDFDWSIERFESEFKNLRKSQLSIIAMGDEIHRVDTSLAAILAAASGTQISPISAFGGPVDLGLPFPLAQAGHTSATNPASPETESEIPPSQPE